MCWTFCGDHLFSDHFLAFGDLLFPLQDLHLIFNKSERQRQPRGAWASSGCVTDSRHVT